MSNKLLWSLLVFPLFLTGSLHAQKLRWGPEAGGNLFRTNLQQGSSTSRVSSRLSLKLGLVADKKINRFFSIQPGLLFNSKSFKYEIDWWYRINYLELPVNAVFRAYVDPKAAFYVAIGPYAAVALNGTENRPYVRYGGIKFGSAESAQFERFDAGVNLSIGMEFSEALYLRLGYSRGLTDIAPQEKVRERLVGFGLSVGYLF